MKKITNASGILQHHFWGDYSASIALRFPSEGDCAAALPLLQPKVIQDFWDACGRQCVGKGWQQSREKPNLASIHAGGSMLEEVIGILVAYGADRKDIESLATSVDYGKPFRVEMEVEVINPAQLELLHI